MCIQICVSQWVINQAGLGIWSCMANHCPDRQVRRVSDKQQCVPQTFRITISVDDISLVLSLSGLTHTKKNVFLGLHLDFSIKICCVCLLREKRSKGEGQMSHKVKKMLDQVLILTFPHPHLVIFDIIALILIQAADQTSFYVFL